MFSYVNQAKGNPTSFKSVYQKLFQSFSIRILMNLKNKTFPVFASCGVISPSDEPAITDEETNVFTFSCG